MNYWTPDDEERHAENCDNCHDPHAVDACKRGDCACRREAGLPSPGGEK